MYSRDSLGIIAENYQSRISIFDTNTLEVVQQIPMDADVIDVAVSGDCARAIVSAFYDKTMFQIDLLAIPAQIVGSAVSQTNLEDVALTPDGRFALAVDGSATNQDIVSYSIRQVAFVSNVPASAQAVAISPKSRDLLLTADYYGNSVHRFSIHSDGTLVDSGQSFPAGSTPKNLAFSPCGDFLFVAATGDDRINVLSTVFPENVVMLGGADCSGTPQSIAVMRDGRHVFVLTTDNVDIFAFDPVAGSLTLKRSFAHGLVIRAYYGVDQIALDACGQKLFVSGEGRLAVFTTYGLPLGTVIGVEGPGGVAICQCGRG